MFLNFRSLQWRLVSIFIILAIFLIIPVGLFLNKQVETQYYNSFKTGIERGFDNWSIGENSTLEEMLEYLSVNKGKNAIIEFSILDAYKSYTVINKDNLYVEYSSDKYYDEGDTHGKLFLNEIIGSDNFIIVLNGEVKGDRNKLVQLNGRRYFDYAREVKLSDGDYILYFRYDSEAWADILNGYNRIILFSLIISIFISFILGYLLSKTITSPIIKLMQRTKRIAAGEFDQITEEIADDEIGQLTNAFNVMAKNLKNTLTEISREKNKIETIFNYMTDGVIAFNLKGEVIHINPASRLLLGEKEFNSDNGQMNFNKFSEKYNLGINLESVLHFGIPGSREINLAEEGRVLKAYFAVFTNELKNPEGIIIVLHDITEEQKLDNMRREFVANVSHELKTPLTTIKSYTETLLDDDRSDRQLAEKFLKVIDTEADRMTRLVRDLLQLSSLDNKQTKWNIKEVSLVDIVKSSINKMEIELRNKGQELKFFVEDSIPLIKADRDRMEQVILNLLSNAIKYTPENGKISIYLESTSNQVYVRVVDTGIGIPKEDLPRIFERFYRVDKARSREMGGTGLGLSIAKEITEIHGGTITVKSEVGKGTEFLLRLPAAETKEKGGESISLTGSL